MMFVNGVNVKSQALIFFELNIRSMLAGTDDNQFFFRQGFQMFLFFILNADERVMMNLYAGM